MAELNILGVLEGAGKTAAQGFNAYLTAKTAEALDRVERRADPVRETVRAASVAPVTDGAANYRTPDVVTETANTWAKPLMIVAAIVAAVVAVKVLRK